MPVSRILTDQRWADVVVDLRHNRTAPLPTRPFAGRRKVTFDGATISGTRRTSTNHPDVGIIKWTDPTGFTGAVVTLPSAGGEFATMEHVLPHLSHLITLATGNKYKNVTDPQERGEEAFVAAMPGLRQILTDDTITAAVPGAVDSRAGIMYRLAWAAVGVPDVFEVPLVLRDWDMDRPIPGDGREDPQQFPEDLTLRGPKLVATWQRSGFETAEVVGYWVERLYPSLERAQNEATQRRTAIEDLATWHAAGFDPEDTLDWFQAARYDGNGFTARFVPADACADLRARGVTAEHLSYLTLGLDPRTAASVAVQHVETWLNVAADPDRVCRYIAAGVGKGEAKKMERSAAPPDDDALRMLAGLLPSEGRSSVL